MRSQLLEDRKIKDPHHDYHVYWSTDGHDLFQRTASQSKWTKVKRLSFTPRRVIAIAAMFEEEE